METGHENKTDEELASDIKKQVEETNLLIVEARQRGLEVDYNLGDAGMGESVVVIILKGIKRELLVKTT